MNQNFLSSRYITLCRFVYWEKSGHTDLHRGQMQTCLRPFLDVWSCAIGFHLCPKLSKVILKLCCKSAMALPSDITRIFIRLKMPFHCTITPFYFTLMDKKSTKGDFLQYRVKKHHSTLEMYTFKVMFLLSYLAYLDEALHMTKSPFLDIEISSTR